MKNAGRQAHRGMVLIEAMVALVVMAAGVLGIAKLNTFFIEVSGQAKARTQAVQLAEGKLEELRSLMVRSQFDAIAGECDSVYGMSASDVQSTAFERCWTTTPDPITEDDDHAEITVLVSWTDRMNVEQVVDVRSIVAWDDPGKAVALVKPGEGAGSHAETPTGRAQIPGNTVPPITSGFTPTVDGLRLKQIDDKWHLADSTGKVVLVATRDDEQFSQIAGNVYIDQNNLSSLTNEVVYVVISDASFCSMTPAKNPASPSALTNYDTGTIYKYFSYRCYVGANWFGNIGVVRTDSANTNDRVCLGDPAVTAVASTVKSDNRHPTLGSSRMYRGYVSAGAFYKSTGIGVQSSDTNDYTEAVYDGHDFLLTRITGNPVDSDCSAKLRLYDNTSPYQPFSTDAVTHTGFQPDSDTLDATETAYLYGGSDTVVLGNPGKLFCFTTTCPDPLPNAATPEITISITGRVTRSPTTGSGKPTTVSMSTNSGGNCTPPSWSGNDAESSLYTCSFTGAGFTGSSWSGAITVTTGSGNFVCQTATTGTASPLPAAPSTATATTYTFNFTDQSISAGSSTFNFGIGETADHCVP
ncbi:hypothetical protein PA01_16230 [Azoarcus sp. PA01]|nr:hypothetical protein PA01_16230 [Azoarcus sp. PA01]